MLPSLSRDLEETSSDALWCWMLTAVPTFAEIYRRCILHFTFYGAIAKITQVGVTASQGCQITTAGEGFSFLKNNCAELHRVVFQNCFYSSFVLPFLQLKRFC